MKGKIMLTVWLLAALFLAACTSGGQPTTEPAAADNTGQPMPTATLDLEDPFVQEAQSYAEERGISLEEAVRRMNVQQALGESGLQERLMQNEADTFAGLWIQHEPTYRIVVAFTEDGQETLQPYVDDLAFADLIEVRTHHYTWDELRHAQQQTVDVLNELGTGASSSIDVRENEVYLEVGNPQLLQEELQAAGLELPQPVTVKAIDPEHLSDTLHAGTDTYTGPEGQTIYFPKQAPSGMFMEALAEGTLLLDANGCLRLSEAGNAEENQLIIWRQGFTLSSEESPVEVLNPDGEVVARVGEPIRMGGGEGRAPDIPGLPDETCPGPYWILGQIEPLEVQATPDG